MHKNKKPTSLFDVTVEPAGEDGVFRVTWNNTDTGTSHDILSTADISEEEALRSWRFARLQLPIGRKLFRFLDGEDGCFIQALDHAAKNRQVLSLRLRTCDDAADWPFELMADGDSFLANRRIHLVRRLSDRGKDKVIEPANRSLKLLFMASSVMGSVLDFELEEETIYSITQPLPIDVDVEDSGSLEGLRRRLERDDYDVVHLSGHTGFSNSGNPYLVMEDETGTKEIIYPDQLWNDALIENPPALLVISGSSVGDTAEFPSGAETAPFARELIREHRLPCVLAWAQSVKDHQAIPANTTIYQQLSRGRSVLTAVQQARDVLMETIRDVEKPAWPMLQLFADGALLTPIVATHQKQRPQLRRMKYAYLENSRVKVLAEGFIGRRRLVQQSLHTLKKNRDKSGVLLLGSGGLGKSCLAGKICERFTDHTLIIVHGRLNAVTLEDALDIAFKKKQDEAGLRILGQEEEMTKKAASLCASVFKEKNYLLLLDDFEQNLEGAQQGEPGPLIAEAEQLLRVFLRYLPATGKMTQMIITCRYAFSLSHNGDDQVARHMENIWLTSFRKTDQYKKLRMLPHIAQYGGPVPAEELLNAGKGNPRLMEWLDILVRNMGSPEFSTLLEAVKEKQETFVRTHLIRELLHYCGKPQSLFLHRVSVYRQPVFQRGIESLADHTQLTGWQQNLQETVKLGLVEHNRFYKSFMVSPLLRDELKNTPDDERLCHEGAAEYYTLLCGTRKTKEPLLWEEWVYHSLKCGAETAASMQGAILVDELKKRLAFKEVVRVGNWIREEKKRPFAEHEDAAFLNNLGSAFSKMGDSKQAVQLYEESLTIEKRVHGESSPAVVVVLENLAESWRKLGQPQKALNYSRQARKLGLPVKNIKKDKDAFNLNQQGGALLDLGRNEEAIDCFRRCIKICRSLGDNMRHLMVNALSHLGTGLMEIAQFDKALECHQEAIQVARGIFPENDPELAHKMINLGLLYQTMGDHSQSLNWYQQALFILRKAYGEIHPDVSITLNNVGMAFFHLGNSKDAEEYVQKALSIEKELYGDTYHPHTARDLTNLGSIFRESGRYEESERFLNQALDIYKTVFDPPHHSVAITLANIGLLMFDQQLPIKSLTAYHHALKLFLETVGEKHPNTAECFEKIGTILMMAERPVQANRYLQCALDIKQEIFGKNHPDLVGILISLAHTWSETGNKKKAVSFYQKTLALVRTCEPDDIPESTDIFIRLGDLFMEMEDFENSVNHFEQALTLAGNFFKDDEPLMESLLEKLTAAYDSLGDIPRFINFRERVLAIKKHTHGNEAPEVAVWLLGLGSLWLNLEKYETAADYFERTLRILEKASGDCLETVIVLNLLGETRSSLNEHDTAVNCFEKALEICEALDEEDKYYLLETLINLNTEFFIIQDFYGAYMTHKRILEIEQAVYGDDSGEVAERKKELRQFEAHPQFKELVAAQPGDANAGNL